MPPNLFPLLLIAFLVALAASAAELRSSLEPPACPECVHCRLAAYQKREREEQLQRAQARRLWGIDDRDDEDRGRRP